MNSNKELNGFGVYRYKKCIYCQRSFPATLLNIEGVIHHKEPFRCIDTKSCRRAKRRLTKHQRLAKRRRLSLSKGN